MTFVGYKRLALNYAGLSKGFATAINLIFKNAITQKILFGCIAVESKKETLRLLIFLTGLANWSIFSLI